MKPFDRLVQTILSTSKAWQEHDFPRIGTFSVHLMTKEAAARMRVNECWVRLTKEGVQKEYRGTAEKVASQLLQAHLKPRSKSVGAALEALSTFNYDGLKAPEAAAMLGLDEEATFFAFDHLMDTGEAGWDPTGFYRIPK